MGLCGIQILKVTYMSYLGDVLSARETKFKVFKDSEIPGVSGFSFWAIEPKEKGRNDRKVRKPQFSHKLMNGVLFSWV